tara:strand:- start:263 stop:763 length:501 start_codon:yes stop_codon:yes gene_type:complete
MLFCKKQVNQYSFKMKKIFFLKFIVFLILTTGCGYTPIFSTKDIKFSIASLQMIGDENLNKILENKLKIYNDSNQEKKFSLLINSNKEKKISSKDTKGNPKTYEIKITVIVSGKHSNGQLKEKIFVKLVNYNNRENKFDLKKYENETSKIFIEKIAEDLIIYLQTI